MNLQDQMLRYLEQAEREMQENERKLGAFRTLEPRLAELVGEGQAAEGKVRATWTQQGLQDLDFDPRALRMTSEVLAREVKAAIAAAIQDLQQQTMMLVDSLGIPAPERPSPEEAQAQLAQFREQVMGAFKASAEDLDRVQRLRQTYEGRVAQHENERRSQS